MERHFSSRHEEIRDVFLAIPYLCPTKTELKICKIHIPNQIQGSETIDSFMTRWRMCARDCNFSDSDELMRDRIVLTHFLIHSFETVPNSKKLQTTTEMRLLKDFKIQIALKILWKKREIAHFEQFTFFHNVFLKHFSSMC